MLHLQSTINLPSVQDLQCLTLEELVYEQKAITQQFTRESFASIMYDLQNQVICHYLGERWQGQPANHEPPPWRCLNNKDHRVFQRRGVRYRTVVSSLGKLTFPTIQLGCKTCGCRFSPFNTLLHLAPRQRYTDEFKQKLVGLVTNLSYKKTSGTSQDFLGLSASPRTIHQWVQQIAHNTSLPPHTSCKAVLLDGTGVLAKDRAKYPKNERTSELKLVIGLGPRTFQYHRPYQEKKILGISVGATWPHTTKRIHGIKTSMLITDGENTFDKIAEECFPGVPRQRCLWHLPRTLGQYLTTFSALSTEQRQPWLKELKDVLYANGQAPALQRQYTLFVKKLRHAGHEVAASMLATATTQVFTHRRIKHKGHRGIATSIIERQMREINRRADVGVLWSNRGLENLLKLKLLQQEEPQYWSEFIWNTTNIAHSSPKLLFQMSR